MKDTPITAQIYLAERRGCSETVLHRSYHTFNFGEYRTEGRESFGALHWLNDDTLHAGAHLTMRIEEPMTVLVLPVTGGLEYKNPLVNGFLEPGQVSLLSMAGGTNYTISNPYDTESINFLQIGLAKPFRDFSPAFSQHQFDLTKKNTLIPILGTGNKETYSEPGHHVFMGQYDGRQDGLYFVTPGTNNSSNSIFVFVLQGAFEVANRLLQERDGLALTYEQAGVLDFEALSNDATLIVVDWSAVH